MQVKDKVAIVTGGASGIGRAVAHHLAREGAKVTIADINMKGATKVTDEIKQLGCEAIAVKVDVTRFEDVNRMVRAILEKFGQIDILVNNAGGAIPGKAGPFAQLTEDIWDQQIRLNLYGTINCSRAVVNHMMERQSGKIVNVASVSGIIGIGTVDYSAAKGGVIAFTKGLAKELGPYGINVNCVSPGSIKTERILKFPASVQEKLLRPVHLRRFGEPNEVANVVVFLASDEASFVTGANYIIDGGFVLGSTTFD